MSDSTKVIPFGKHKGKLIEEVQVSDPQYLQWLIGQAWVRDKHVALYQTIINYGVEPSETPEHNALQVLFLDDTFCLRFAQRITGGFRGAALADVGITRGFEVRGIDVVLEVRDRREPPKGEPPAELVAALAAHETLAARRPEKDGSIDELVGFAQEIGVRAADIEYGRAQRHASNLNLYIRQELSSKRYSLDEQVSKLNVEAEQRWRKACGTQWIELSIELKPSVGDDYPAVLRQMRACKSNVLFLESYTGSGATEAQFIATFRSAGITVVFRRDLD
jgi:hypothetical protein